MVAFGHSYLQGGGVTHVDRQFITLLAGLMRTDLRDLGVGGSQAACDELWLGSTTGGGFKAHGGWANVLQNVTPFRAGAPYGPGTNALPLVCTGLNDLLQRSHQATGNPRTIFKTALRTHLSRLCASKVFEEWAGIAFGGVTWPNAIKGDTNKNSGTGYYPIPGNGATFTITLPADFEGGAVAIGLTVWPASDGQITWTGTASQLPATTALAGLAYADGTDAATQGGAQRHSSNGHVVRITGLLASDAGKTIIGTYGSGAGTTFSTPSAPGAITQGGTGGATTYTYERVYRTYNGDTIPSSTTSTATGNATLSGTNYNQISAGSAWPDGVEAELIVRTVGGSTQGVVAILTAGPAIVQDQYPTAPYGAYTAATANPLVGGAAFDYWQIESNNPITSGVVLNIAKLPADIIAAQSPTVTATDFDNYNADIASVVGEFASNQFLLVDVSTLLAQNDAYFNGTHPNDRGYAIIAETVSNAIASWAKANIAVRSQAMQSRVSRSVRARNIIRAPLSVASTGAVPLNYQTPMWGDNASGFRTLTGSWADIDGTNVIMQIDAQVGDDLELTLSGTWSNNVANAASLDVCTVDANGNLINYWATGTSSPAGFGQGCWLAPNSAIFAPITGSAVYTVQAADLITFDTVPGIVSVKLRGLNAAGRILYLGNSQIAFSAHLKNLGQRNIPGFNAS